jgi:transposase
MTTAGYRELLLWVRSFRLLIRVGIEGTGAYGAGLFRHHHDKGVVVVGVNRPNRQLRRRPAKSDINFTPLSLDSIAGTLTLLLLPKKPFW